MSGPVSIWAATGTDNFHADDGAQEHQQSLGINVRIIRGKVEEANLGRNQAQ